MLSLFHSNRAVERTGKVVTCTFMAGGFVGNPVEYTLPSVAKAKAFQAVALQKDENGNPISIPPEWSRFRKCAMEVHDHDKR